LILKDNDKVKEEYLEEEGIKGVYRKILLGLEDGSEEIIMRLFKILPGGYTYFHQHDYEHLVKVEKGRGIVVDGEGKEINIQEGQSLFIRKNEKHQFKNPFQEPFEFLCIIKNPDK